MGISDEGGAVEYEIDAAIYRTASVRSVSRSASDTRIQPGAGVRSLTRRDARDCAGAAAWPGLGLRRAMEGYVGGRTIGHGGTRLEVAR
jgi:hypothetical protein